jgi:D-alanyl-D-alanine carboxypeptidase
VALVVMDAFGKYTHFADASRLRTWIETGKVMPVPASALSYKKQREAQMAGDTARAQKSGQTTTITYSGSVQSPSPSGRCIINVSRQSPIL